MNEQRRGRPPGVSAMENLRRVATARDWITPGASDRARRALLFPECPPGANTTENLKRVATARD